MIARLNQAGYVVGFEPNKASFQGYGIQHRQLLLMRRLFGQTSPPCSYEIIRSDAHLGKAFDPLEVQWHIASLLAMLTLPF